MRNRIYELQDMLLNGIDWVIAKLDGYPLMWAVIFWGMPGLPGLLQRSIGGFLAGIALAMSASVLAIFNQYQGYAVYLAGFIVSGWIGLRSRQKQTEERRHREILEAIRQLGPIRETDQGPAPLAAPPDRAARSLEGI